MVRSRSRRLDVLAEKFGFTYDKYPVPPASMTEQKSIWLQIRKTKPDYAIMWGWGAMNGTAVKEAANIRFPMDKFIGNWWSGGNDAVVPAGKSSVGLQVRHLPRCRRPASAPTRTSKRCTPLWQGRVQVDGGA